MNFEDDILKGKFFPLNDRDRLKTTMINLFILVVIILFSFDLYESFDKGLDSHTLINIGMIILLLLLYALFPYVISLQTVIYATLLFITLFLLVSLSVKNIYPQILLFWFSTIPLSLFYFLGVSKAMKVSFTIFFILLFLTFATKMGWLMLVYDSSTMFKISMGFFIVSYWIYLIEKERSVYENDLSTALAGQEVLFKEVHHRTKNNMQVMMGLLETQSFKIEDPQYKKMFQAHVERIKAMSLVHENLYKNEMYEKVDMHKYLGELSDSLQKFTPHTIITEIDFVYLDMKISMSIGLIFNEAVSNAIEHAYSAGNGYIDVSLKCVKNQCTLIIKDYGIGFNTDKIYHTLGMTLIEDLSRSLPKGRMEIKVDDGTEIKVYFNAEEG